MCRFSRWPCRYESGKKENEVTVEAPTPKHTASLEHATNVKPAEGTYLIMKNLNTINTIFQPTAHLTWMISIALTELQHL